VKLADKAPAGDPLRPLMDRGMPNFTQLRYRMSVAQANPSLLRIPRAGDNPALRLPVTRFTVNFALTTDGLTLVPIKMACATEKSKLQLLPIARTQLA